jgi:hypothetical protein
MAKITLIFFSILYLNCLNAQQYDQRNFQVGDTSVNLPIPNNYREAGKNIKWVAELNKKVEQGNPNPSANMTVLVNLLPKKPGLQSSIEANPQDYIDCYVLTANEYNFTKCTLRDFSKITEAIETQYTGTNPKNSWAELAKESLKNNKYATAADIKAYEIGRPTCIDRTDRHIILATPQGEGPAFWAMVLNSGKILHLYTFKTNSETLQGINEMKSWVAEIEKMSPAEAPINYSGTILSGLMRAIAYLIGALVISAFIIGAKKIWKWKHEMKLGK